VNEIESIGGRLAPGGDRQLIWFVITYSDGDEKHCQGTLLEATELASTHNLVVVPAPGSSFKWVRDSRTRRPSYRAAS